MGYLSKVSDIVDTEMRSKSEGFTLIELMIVVAIIAILAAISVPNFMSYRNKARIASAVSTMGQVRGAMASYASSYLGNPFPPDDAITDWNSLATVGNAHGATLKATEEEAGIAFISYGCKHYCHYIVTSIHHNTESNILQLSCPTVN